MAMTKAERAEVQALRERAALGWSSEPEPERMPLPPHPEYANGWSVNEHTERVCRAWTGSNVHGIGRHLPMVDGVPSYDWKNTSGSQNGRRLYATEADALVALRIALSRKFAKALAVVDAEIMRARSES
jgi:hypothetical protein